jgi:hypothetical protein
MSSTEAPISINLKTAGGTQITLRAETAEQFADMIAQGIHTVRCSYRSRTSSERFISK